MNSPLRLATLRPPPGPTPLARLLLPALQRAALSTETRTSGGSAQAPPPLGRPPARRDDPKPKSEPALAPVASTSSSQPVPSTSAAVFVVKKGSTSASFVNAEVEKEQAEKALEKAKEKAAAKKGTRLQRFWAATKEEAKHYWHGFKLLSRETRISWRLLRKLLRGESLTRREDRQLRRTSKDLLRTIPFSVFIIVPLGEALLPVFIKLFPSMLPSTFAKEFEKEEQQRKLLKVRLETAKFLQTTIRESPLSPSERTRNSTAYKEFFRKVRATGENPSTEDILKVASLFEDNLTLDNLSRPQLISMCRYMNINAFGTDNFLRHTVRGRLNQLERDDRTIDSEGLDSLRESELIHACQSRGIRTSNKSQEELRDELSQWIDLHVKQHISGALLFLCKAFSFTQEETASPTENMIASIKDVLSSLPDELVSETELDISESTATPQQRLEVLEQQEDLIEDEAEQEAREQEARRLKKEADAAKKEEEDSHLEEETEHATSGDTTGTARDEPTESGKEPDPEEETDARMTKEQLSELGAALSILSDKSSVLKERADLKALMEDNRLTTVVDESSAASSSEQVEHESEEVAEDERARAAESKRKASLSKRIGKMIQKLDEQLDAYDKTVGQRMNMISVDKDGKIREDDLRKALQVIAHRPDDDTIDGIIEKLDVDGDGQVPLEDIVGLAEGEGLGIVLEEDADSLVKDAKKLRKEPLARPKKEDILDD